MDNTQIAKRIKELCRQKNISVKELLEKCNIHKGFIYTLEKGNNSPIISKICTIADYFNVSIDYIVGRTDNKEINK